MRERGFGSLGCQRLSVQSSGTFGFLSLGTTASLVAVGFEI